MASSPAAGSRAAYIPFMAQPQAQAAAWTNPSNSPTGTYGAAVNQNAGDYDKIMGRYDTLFGQAQSKQNSNISVPTVQGTSRQYQAGPGYSRSEGLTDVMNRLSGFADTGGYSDDDINAFRSRGLSPIRSIYASAQENLRRQKALQGGYSPNYGAMQAKLAREQSGIIGQHTMDLNADIAGRVQEGKKFGLEQLSPLAANENSTINNMRSAETAGRNAFENANVGDANHIAELNAQLALDTDKTNASNASNWMSQALAANQGAASLYGTTPALTQMFGNQLLASNGQNLQAQTAAANINQQRANTGTNLVNMGAVQRPISYGTYSGMPVAGRG